MSNAVAVAEQPRKLSLLVDMATRYRMEPKAFADTLRATVVPPKATNEEFAAFLMVAHEYNLNPVTKEIYAFPKQGGGIQPIVSVDGWANLINSKPQCDGFEFDDVLNDKGELVSVTCRIYRKDRSRPTTATEYMAECRRDTSTWKQWPRRMLRHKALIQAARYAFGFAGIVDPDEAERFTTAPQQLRAVQTREEPPAPPPAAAAAQVIEHSASAEHVDQETGEIVERRLPPPPSLADLKATLQWIDDGCATATSGEELELIWNTEIDPVVNDMMPPDVEDALALLRKHEGRFQ